MSKTLFRKDLQYYKFCMYGFLKNLRFFDPFLLLFFLEKGLSFFEAGIVYGIREITVNILEIPTGIIADVLGRRRTLIFSFMMYIASFIIFYFAESYAVLIVAMIVFSIGDAFRSGTHKAMIFTYLKINDWQDQKVNYYGHTRSWSQAGSALSAIIAASIVFVSQSYQLIFLISIIPYLLDTVLLISYPSYLDKNQAKKSKTTISEEFRSTISNFVTSLKSRSILKAITNVSIFSGYYKALKDYVQPLIGVFALGIPFLGGFEEKEKTALGIGIIYFIIFMLNSVASRNSGKFAKNQNLLSLPLNISLIAGFLIGVVSGLLYEYQYLFGAMVLFVLVFNIENIRKPIGVSYLADIFEDKVHATALSANSQLKALFAAIIAPLAGLMADKLGIGMSITIISILLLVLFPLFRTKSKS